MWGQLKPGGEDGAGRVGLTLAGEKDLHSEDCNVYRASAFREALVAYVPMKEVRKSPSQSLVCPHRRWAYGLLWSGVGGGLPADLRIEVARRNLRRGREGEKGGSKMTRIRSILISTGAILALIAGPAMAQTAPAPPPAPAAPGAPVDR